MKYLVTGGAGFIGSNIAAELVKRGETVCILDNFFSGRKENISQIKNDIELINGDIRDSDAVSRSMSGVDIVIHQAAIPSVELSVADPVGSSEVNIFGTIGLLEAARAAKVKRFVFASSSAVYGDLPDLPKTEQSKTKTLSPYAASKLVGEYFCRIYYELYGLETVALRYFNVFGPNQSPASDYAAVIPKFVNALLASKQPIIFGDGLQSRDFVYVDNVVSANLLASEAPGVAGKMYNIAGGVRFTLLDLLEALRELLSVDIEPIFKPEKQGDIKHSGADTSLAEKELGFRIDVDFREGLNRTIEYFRSRIPESAPTS